MHRVAWEIPAPDAARSPGKMPGETVAGGRYTNIRIEAIE
jgi:hypothetical protein